MKTLWHDCTHLYIQDSLACIAYLIITEALKHLRSCLLKGAHC